MSTVSKSWELRETAKNKRPAPPAGAACLYIMNASSRDAQSASSIEDSGLEVSFG